MRQRAFKLLAGLVLLTLLFASALAEITEGDSTLSRGMRGEAVETLQLRLIELGYLKGEADGIFGGNTERALKAFQRKNDLAEDGVATPEVQEILFAEGVISYYGYAAGVFDPETSAAPRYIGNLNTGKFHRLYCGSVKQMKDSNKVPLYSREQAIEEGYVPCKNCHP